MMPSCRIRFPNQKFGVAKRKRKERHRSLRYTEQEAQLETFRIVRYRTRAYTSNDVYSELAHSSPQAPHAADICLLDTASSSEQASLQSRYWHFR